MLNSTTETKQSEVTMSTLSNSKSSNFFNTIRAAFARKQRSQELQAATRVALARRGLLTLY